MRDIETRHKAFLFFNNEKVDNNCKTMFILGTFAAGVLNLGRSI